MRVLPFGGTRIFYFLDNQLIDRQAVWWQVIKKAATEVTA